MHSKFITNKKAIKAIIDQCQWCYFSMVDGENKPYVIPMNFGMVDMDYIYLHTGPEGQKMEFIKDNMDVCIAMHTEDELKYQNESVACSYFMSFKSVIIKGKLKFIEEIEDKVECLNIVMSKYTDKKFTYNSPSLKNVVVFKIKVEEITAKEKW